MPLSPETIASHHATLHVGCDPESPFYKKVDFQKGLLSLPIEDQHEIYDMMPPKLKGFVDAYMKEKRNGMVGD